MEPLRSRINTISVKFSFILLPSRCFPLTAPLHGNRCVYARNTCTAQSRVTCFTDRESIALLKAGRVASQATFAPLFSRPDRILIKGKEGFVDFKDIVLAPHNKVLHD